MLHLSTKQIITLALMLIILPIIQVKTTYAASPDVCTSLSSCITDTITWATGPSLGLASGSIGGFIFNLTSFIGALLFSLSALMILLGGILYILSAGDESRAAQAKKMITYAFLCRAPRSYWAVLCIFCLLVMRKEPLSQKISFSSRSLGYLLSCLPLPSVLSYKGYILARLILAVLS